MTPSQTADDTNPTLDARILALKLKYRRLRIPPLVAQEGNDYLLRGATLKIFQQGFHPDALPLAVLLANSDVIPGKDKWSGDGGTDFYHNCEHWTGYCDELRKNALANLACENCDRSRARQIESENITEARAYLCPHGCIDFAVPIRIEDRVIAVLFSGQMFPEEGSLWNRAIIEPNGWFSPLQPGEEGIDLYRHSQGLIAKADKSYFPGANDLLLQVSREDRKNERILIDPEGVSILMRRLNELGPELSRLAELVVHGEKIELKTHWRKQIQNSLRPILDNPGNGKMFFERLIKIVPELAEAFDFEYFAMFHRHPENRQVELLCSYGLDKIPKWSFDFPGVETEGNLSKVFKKGETFSGFISIKDLAGPSFLTPLLRLYGKHPESVVWSLSFHHEKHYDLAIIIGNRGRDFAENSMLKFDREKFESLIWEIPRMAEAVYLINQMSDTTQRESLILFEMAHGIRNPIQAIILRTEAIRAVHSGSEDLANDLQSLSVMAQRLNMISDRVWAINDLENNTYKRKVEAVVLSEVIHSAINLSREQAEEDGITFQIDGPPRGVRGKYFFDEWPHLVGDRRLIFLVFVNLINNALKYSKPNTEIRIDGERTATQLKVSIVNVGLSILDREKDDIFKRGYRTPLAREKVSGAGLGLYLVKTIMDPIGGVEVNSTPFDDRHHVVEFKLCFKLES